MMWPVVTAQELRELWVAGRGLVLLIGFSVLLGVMTYLAASNQALNFLEQREAVNLTLQVAVAVGALLALLAGADTISGERERGTLEALLLTPVPRAALLAGKLLAALSLWGAAIVVTVPYLIVLGRGVGVVGEAVGTGLAAGTLLAVALTALGVVISALAPSNRLSLSVSLFVLLALYAPTQLPTGARHGWFGEALLRVDPVSATEHYVGGVVIDGRAWTDELSWLAAPLVAAVVLTVVALTLVPRRLTLRGGAAG